jgi:hypothetical protein
MILTWFLAYTESQVIKILGSVRTPPHAAICIHSASNLQQLPCVNRLIDSILQLRYINFKLTGFFSKRIVVLSCNYNHVCV